MTEQRSIYCCGCESDVKASLVTGRDVYPHRSDLHSLPFWKCFACGNFVGCHHKTADRTRPLGVIPTPEIKYARRRIHQILDPLWKRGFMKRRVVYETLSRKLGFEYHTAELRSVDQARDVYRAVLDLRHSIGVAP
ncbi:MULTISPECIES: zinc-finger-containing protein [Hyphobacterium]|uniref:Zinc-finger-containing protein n=1 Tax=Hyphobacterium vulgare TaxID=1736751 RepID=A0ABV6ZUC7_9PROT